MKTEGLNNFNLFVMGTLFVGLGIFVLNTSTLFLSALIYIFGFIFILNGLFKVFNLVFKPVNSKEKGITLTNMFVNIIAGVIVLMFPNMPISLFAIGFIFYTIALGITHGVNFYILNNNKVKGRGKELVTFLFYIFFSCFLGFAPYLHINVIMNVIACYFILYGFMYYKDLFLQVIPIQKQNQMKRHLRISLPVFLQAIMPKVILDNVNQFLIPSDEKEIDARSDFSQYNSDEKVDVEIYIHASNEGFGKVGHVDICIGNEFLSYGNYDAESIRLFETIGDGVLIVAHKEDYIPFVIRDSKKTLFCFGLKLDDDQKKHVVEKLKEIKDNIYAWKPPKFKGENDAYASRMSKTCDETAFYKFKKGKFKTYFVCTTNCVQLADYIIGSTGMDILNLNGIITPGAYYEYLERQFSLKKEMILYKKIYN